MIDPASASLFTGDAVFNAVGTLTPLIPQFTADVAQAMDSLRKLGGLSYERILFAHGPAIDRDGPATLRRLVAGGWQPTPAQQQLAAALQACCS